MKHFYLFVLVFVSLSTIANRFDLPETLESRVYSETVKTVEMYREGWKLSNPIIDLGSDQNLVLSFDDLSNELKDLRYTVFHCNRDWQISQMSQLEYLDGNTDFPLTDFAFSRNTKFRYINYSLTLPNNDINFIMSGNYVLVVYDDGDAEKPIITWRFYVVEQKVAIVARISKGQTDLSGKENQEFDFTIDKGNLQLQNPNTDIKVVINQNNRTDNSISNLKPLYLKGNVLDYDYNKENNFKGENEFRFFELRSIKYNGERVESILFMAPYYHITLLPDEPRFSARYSYNRDMNGNFNVEATHTDKPETEADYMFVHFTLKMPMPLMGGVYVFGKLSNWQFNKENMMKYNFETRQYELSLLLKQGYYNYGYAYKLDGEPIVSMHNIEGSHFETENEYQVYVYYGKRTDRYDRLVGFNKFSSVQNRGSF